MTDDRDRWNEKYADPAFDLPEEPIPELARRIDTLPEGRALDVATGTGRNAIFLAACGYDVEAIDVADAALEAARTRADERGVEVDWIRADISEVSLDRDAYDVITVSFFDVLEHLETLVDALAPGGVLVYDHHLRTTDPIDVGPSSDEFRFEANELLRACLDDLTVLSYEERRRPEPIGGRADESDEGDAADRDRQQIGAVATLVARNSSGETQSYPILAERDDRGAGEEPVN
ncbi:class I SAM-dependent methyltransferase [Natrarchaeobaculum aegyptiacum]|uniref:SAM-dependent methyltransferase n=1 Tax=Natrarchaeobaculum aegyptiacum TaxID=745377 RepID=A0A2Z2HYA6_9EURY|nr:class I SAM-dependent methyltransferase [Natrarchaeobaculum aegyptiacum]ARS91933.1 SAM-dependent methyltransferase [Natrarchaeobaculum aegyptiacum]